MSLSGLNCLSEKLLIYIRTPKSVGLGTFGKQSERAKMSKNSSHSSGIRAILCLLNLLISDEWQRDEGKGQTRKDRAEMEKWEGAGVGWGGVGAVTLRDWRWM